MRIGVLTAGGDAAGLNAAIRALGVRALNDGHEILGIQNGWAGLVGELDAVSFGRREIEELVGQGGTVLGTSRYNLDDPTGGREQVLATITNELDAVVAIGGDGTQRIANWLAEHGAPIIGLPKTLDNDLVGTQYCIGFDTAVSIVAESIDRLQTTAASHHRVIVVETMGRYAGWIAALGGLAGGADLVVIPEFPMSLDEIDAHATRRKDEGFGYSIICVAEGVTLASLGGSDVGEPQRDAIGRVRLETRGVGHYLAARLEERGHRETRTTVLGHVQRGGTPTAHDRIWATGLGAAAYDAVVGGRFGVIPVVRNDTMVEVPLREVTQGQRTVPREVYDLCAAFF